MNWRRNGGKLSRRKMIREELRRRMEAARAANDRNAYSHWVGEYCAVQAKIRRFYDVVPINHWWPIHRRAIT